MLRLPWRLYLQTRCLSRPKFPSWLRALCPVRGCRPLWRRRSHCRPGVTATHFAAFLLVVWCAAPPCSAPRTRPGVVEESSVTMVRGVWFSGALVRPLATARAKREAINCFELTNNEAVLKAQRRGSSFSFSTFRLEKGGERQAGKSLFSTTTKQEWSLRKLRPGYEDFRNNW